jgi:RNA polymerase sigma factor (sigma-70 family)
MDCQELTKPSVALEIMQNPGDTRLPQLFHCIYSRFHDSFISWILNRYSNGGSNEKLQEDAKDAFQNGLLELYDKAKKKELSIKGSLKTVVYSFGLLQLLAALKKEKKVHKVRDHMDGFDALFENDLLESERQELFDKKEKDLMEALLTRLPERQRDILFMRYFGKLRSRQIAEKLGISVGNVDNETAKAYKALRNILKVKQHFKDK